MNCFRLIAGFAPALAFAASVFVVGGCTTTYPQRDPTGQTFPAVTGERLDGVEVTLPADVAGKVALLLVGYKQETQFDIDRWLLALEDAGVKLPVLEVPTIPGLLPGLFAGSIDAGMRSGIPREDWATVVTVYGDADKIAGFTGNENGLPARVLLLDPGGRVVYFHDEGFSVASFRALQAAIRRVIPAPPVR